MDFSLLSLVIYLLLHHPFCSVIIECFHSRGSDVASIYANLLEQKKALRLHKKRVQLPGDWFGTPTWPPFHCFGTPIWPP